MAASSILFATTMTGPVRRTQDLGDLLVAGSDPDARVDDEDDHVGLVDRGPGL